MIGLRHMGRGAHSQRNPAKTVHSTNAGLMLGHRLRRCPNITQHWLTVPCLLDSDCWANVAERNVNVHVPPTWINLQNVNLVNGMP